MKIDPDSSLDVHDCFYDLSFQSRNMSFKLVMKMLDINLFQTGTYYENVHTFHYSRTLSNKETCYRYWSVGFRTTTKSWDVSSVLHGLWCYQQIQIFDHIPVAKEVCEHQHYLIASDRTHSLNYASVRWKPHKILNFREILKRPLQNLEETNRSVEIFVENMCWRVYIAHIVWI